MARKYHCFAAKDPVFFIKQRRTISASVALEGREKVRKMKAGHEKAAAFQGARSSDHH